MAIATAAAIRSLLLATVGLPVREVAGLVWTIRGLSRHPSLVPDGNGRCVGRVQACVSPSSKRQKRPDLFLIVFLLLIVLIVMIVEFVSFKETLAKAHRSAMYKEPVVHGARDH
jgi:predicted nucleic acid-binding Zn ribbon protein